MPATPFPAELHFAAPDIAGRLAFILRGLIAVFARVFLRHPLYAATALPLCQYLNRTIRRFDGVMQRLAAGTLRHRPPRPGRSGSGKPPFPFPRQAAWLLVALKHEGAYFRHRIETLLAEPDVARLVAAAPQAQRLLRPICHMLGVMPAAIRPTPRRRRNADAPDRGPELSARTNTDSAVGTQPAAPPRQGSACRNSAQLADRPRDRLDDDLPAADSLCPRLRTRWPFRLLAQFRQE